MKKFFLVAIVALVALAGCSEKKSPEQLECSKKTIYAISPEGVCAALEDPCYTPENFEVVEKCPEVPGEPQAGLCAGISCADKCENGARLENGSCSEGKCVYGSVVENSPLCTFGPSPPAQTKYDFDVNLLFCEYNSPPNSYDFFYQIRNRTENSPTYKSVVWMKAPEIDYGQQKTIQATYKKGQLLWEEKRISYLGKSFRGQEWQIRNLDSNRELLFQLIFCEPEYSEEGQCTAANGIVLHEGKTSEFCE